MWLRCGVSPVSLKSHRLQRREPQPRLLVDIETTFARRYPPRHGAKPSDHVGRSPRHTTINSPHPLPSALTSALLLRILGDGYSLTDESDDASETETFQPSGSRRPGP